VKLLFSSLFLPSEQDGLSYSTRHLVKEFIAKGTDVTVYTTNWRWNSSDISRFKSDKLQIHAAHFNNSFDLSFGAILTFWRTVRNFDLVHFNSIYSVSTAVGALLCRAFRVPYTISPSGNFLPSIDPEDNRGISGAAKKRLFFKLLAKEALKKASMIICQSQSEMEVFRKRTSLHNVTIIPNGLDPSTYLEVVDPSIIDQKLGFGRRKNMCLFLGRFSEEKALPFLLEAWALVIKRQPDATLVLAGPCDGGFHARLKGYVEKLPDQASVVFPGAVSGDLKIALLQNCKCLLLPSYFESFGNVVLEALASGRPVIASAGTPWQSLESYRLGKWIKWEKEIWANAILELMSDDYYNTQTFRNYSRQWVADNFEWDHIADQYLRLYSNTLMGDRRALHKSIADHTSG